MNKEELKVGEVGTYYIAKNMYPYVKITDSKITYNFLSKVYDERTVEHREEFIVLGLNNSNYINDVNRHSLGSITGTIVDIRMIFQFLITRNCVGFILSHNHPSGTLKPSAQDIKLTKKIMEASQFMNIKFLDHIIYTPNGYLSMADEGLM